MNDMGLLWSLLYLLGWAMVVAGAMLTLFATVIAYRFFDQSSVVKYCLKIGGIVLCLVGFLLTSEMYRY